LTAVESARAALPLWVPWIAPILVLAASSLSVYVGHDADEHDQ
jgi:hypothetical protein